VTGDLESERFRRHSQVGSPQAGRFGNKVEVPASWYGGRRPIAQFILRPSAFILPPSSFFQFRHLVSHGGDYVTGQEAFEFLARRYGGDLLDERTGNVRQLAVGDHE
jgi:hypothetical protein